MSKCDIVNSINKIKWLFRECGALKMFFFSLSQVVQVKESYISLHDYLLAFILQNRFVYNVGLLIILERV